MAAPFTFDPTPVPIKDYAARMGKTEETLVLLHLKGEFPALRKIGRDWYVLPASVVRMSFDGDEAEGREMEGDVGRSDGQAPPVLQQAQRRTRGSAQGGGHAQDPAEHHALED